MRSRLGASLRPVIVMAMTLFASCGEDPPTESGRASRPWAGVYELQGRAADVLPVYVILSRKGAFLVCNRPLRSGGLPVLGRWRETTAESLEFQATHFVWSHTVPMGVPVQECGHPIDAIVPREPAERATLYARVEGAGFRWPFNWGDSERPLCSRVVGPPDAWVVPYLDFDIPDDAVYGGGSAGALVGSYQLEKAAFAETLRAAAFEQPEALARAAKIELEIQADGSFQLSQNRAWVGTASRAPVRVEGRWLMRGGELYLRVLSTSGKPYDGLRLMWLHPEAEGLNYDTPTGISVPDGDPYDMEFRVVKRGR